MESLLLAVLPYLNAGGSISLIIMLRIAWSIYQKIVQIEKELVGYKVEIENIKERVDKVEARDVRAVN